MIEQQSKVQLPPVTKSVTVDLTPEAAFRRFTEEISAWWPMARYSVGQEKTESVTLEGSVGGKLFEQYGDGGSALWGTVTEWEPPTRVAFTWHPGREPETAQQVEVDFVETNGRTTVTLVHRDWDVLGADAEKQRSDYDGGWDAVLKRFAG